MDYILLGQDRRQHLFTVVSFKYHICLRCFSRSNNTVDIWVNCYILVQYGVTLM